MPGKQMSIDADMNMGLIDEHEARRRRAQVEKEASFYGAMDGATTFVKRDAIAGIIIRSEEHTSELQSLMRSSYAVFCMKNQKDKKYRTDLHKNTNTNNN